MTDLVGQSVGPYTITERIGGGGMADVYKAFHAGLSVYRAFKVIRPELSLTDDFRARFQKEARSVAALRHPNIVQVHDFGEHGTTYYMVMEFIEGSDLKKVLRAEGRLRPIETAVGLVMNVANALEYAHQHGLIHRDIKPENIMITTGGQPILTDFGIAKLLTGGGTKLTQTGGSLGTPAYMAPEQALGQGELGPSVDIYALTVVLFELLTGRVPYEGDTPVAALMKTVSEPLPLPRQFAPDISEQLQKVIVRGTAKQPAERFDSMTSLREALAVALRQDAETVVRGTVVVSASLSEQSTGRRSRTALAVAAGVACAAVAAGALVWNSSRKAEQPVIADSQPSAATTLESQSRDTNLSTPAVTAADATMPRESPDTASRQQDVPPSQMVSTPAQSAAPPQRSQGGDNTASSSKGSSREVGAKQESKPIVLAAARNEPTKMASSEDKGTEPPAASLSSSAPIVPAPASGNMDQVRKGQTTQADLIRLFGGPNLTTVDEVGRETWIYERTQAQTDVRTTGQATQAAARLGLFFGNVDAGAAAAGGRSSQTVSTVSTIRSITVIVKFAPDRTVIDYTVKETYF